MDSDTRPGEDEIRERIRAFAAAAGRPMAELAEGYKRLSEITRRATWSFAELTGEPARSPAPGAPQ